MRSCIFSISRGGILQQNPVFSDHAQSDGIFSGAGKDVVSVVSDRDGDVLFHAWLYPQEYMAAKGGGCASSADACALFPADLPRYDGEQPWGIQDSGKMDGHLDHVLSDCGGSAAFEGIYRDHDEILPQAVFYDSDLPVFPFGYILFVLQTGSGTDLPFLRVFHCGKQRNRVSSGQTVPA